MRAFVALGLMVVSCTFPDVSYSGDATAPVDASAEASVDAGEDTAPPVDAGGDTFDPCDQDKDGYKSIACDGGDCNDNDPRVNPGVTQFIPDVPDAYPWGDWNCDKNTEYQYPTITCGLGVACNTLQGFPSPGPGCGFSAEFVDCSGLCSLADAGKRTQGCR